MDLSLLWTTIKHVQKFNIIYRYKFNYYREVNGYNFESIFFTMMKDRNIKIR